MRIKNKDLPDAFHIADYEIIDGEPYIKSRKAAYYRHYVGEGCDRVYVFEGADDDGNKEVCLVGGFGLELTIKVNKDTGEIEYHK